MDPKGAHGYQRLKTQTYTPLNDAKTSHRHNCKIDIALAQLHPLIVPLAEEIGGMLGTS